ncbi:kinase-like domain-containing protein [Aspergillus foveolatus]|uniref:kinase-like domain-containing protein n=1 Tax=Aspergillus foveolatus TaxID=210207 RepID=UPI003CCE40E6
MIGLRLLNRMLKRTFSLHSKPFQFPFRFASPVPQHELMDEEACPAYSPKHIGWGTRSTIWLAKDIRVYIWQPDRFVALKIINNRSTLEAYHERDIEEHISRQSPIHRGRGIIRTCLDSFEVAGPDGILWILQKRFVWSRLPLSIAKAYLLILLAGLDYLHSECRLDNILMTFENQDILPNFVKEQTTNLPMQCKTDPTSGRTIYHCHNDFGSLNWRELRKMLPKIVDFGLATRLESDNQGQPDNYRAPVVILGCPWSFSADIWNIGVLLLAQSDAMADFSWPNPIMNENRQALQERARVFNGPFFDENCKRTHPQLPLLSH